MSVVNMQRFCGCGLGFFFQNQPVVEMCPCLTHLCLCPETKLPKLRWELVAGWSCSGGLVLSVSAGSEESTGE